jgi:hypothetical protein
MLSVEARLIADRLRVQIVSSCSLLTATDHSRPARAGKVVAQFNGVELTGELDAA